jgi:hypothetical protein
MQSAGGRVPHAATLLTDRKRLCRRVSRDCTPARQSRSRTLNPVLGFRRSRTPSTPWEPPDNHGHHSSVDPLANGTSSSGEALGNARVKVDLAEAIVTAGS